MTDSSYLREAPGLPSIKTQKVALGLDTIAEHDPVYIDLNPKRKRSTPGEPYPELALCIRALRKGEKLRVYGPEILGGSHAQIVAVMKNVAGKGATIYDAVADMEVALLPEAMEALAWAQRGETTHRVTALKKARKKRVEQGRKGGPVPSIKKDVNPKAHAAAAKIWLNLDHTAKQAAEQIGVSVATCYRYLPERGGTIFGRKPK
jgi:DNA invertase Pin-like site-specific DNA recombinase